MIPKVDIEAGRKPRIVQFVIEKFLKPVVEYRESLFDHAQPLPSPLAKRMLVQGYKQPSRFGRWCPVQVIVLLVNIFLSYLIMLYCF